MEESTYRAALVGDLDCTEMAPIRAAVARHLSGWDIREFSGLKTFNEAGLTADYFPDLILVAQRFRDESSAEEVRRAFETFPVARFICVSGAWCESEGRHGSRWPMAVRIPLRFLEIRLATEAAVVEGKTPALPLTAARDEVFDFDTDQKRPLAPREGITVAILSPDRELRQWLADLCREAGYSASSKNESMPADVLIVDLDPLTKATRDLLKKLKQEQPASRMVGLMGVVLPEDRNSLQNHVLVALLSKLTPVAGLLEAIREASHGFGPGE